MDPMRYRSSSCEFRSASTGSRRRISGRGMPMLRRAGENIGEAIGPTAEVAGISGTTNRRRWRLRCLSISGNTPGTDIPARTSSGTCDAGTTATSRATKRCKGTIRRSALKVHRRPRGACKPHHGLSLHRRAGRPLRSASLSRVSRPSRDSKIARSTVATRIATAIRREAVSETRATTGDGGPSCPVPRIANYIELNALAGCGRRCLAPTTVSSPRPA